MLAETVQPDRTAGARPCRECAITFGGKLQDTSNTNKAKGGISEAVLDIHTSCSAILA